MVFYEFDATTPANTAESSPLETAMRVNAGIIHFVEVMFPAGCAGLTHARIKQGGFQLYPRNESGSLKGDRTYLRFSDFYEVMPGEGHLRLITWNDSKIHQHKVTVRIGILQPGEMFPEIKVADLIRLFFRQFRRRA